MIVTLLGYMGAGKSTIGLQLSKSLSYEFIDLDKFIEKREGQTIQNIFKSKGEIYFRKMENSCLNEIYSLENNIILSIGGGTPCFYGNMELINSEYSKSFYLKLLPKTLSNRLFFEKGKRPLISHLETQDNLLEFIAIHLFERQVFYNKADYVLSIDQKPVNEIVNLIIKKL
jgi:shikimate kinase